MAKTLSDHLLNTLEELVPYDFEKFKFSLQNTNLDKGLSRIPRGQVKMARPVKLANLLLSYYGEAYAVRLTVQVLRATNQRLLAEELRKATGPGRSQDKAACPLCHTQEGDLHGSTLVQSFCSCSIAPGDPKASGRCSPVCPQCQRPLASKSCEAQSPQLLPQCPRHMKQVQLLFCEDHREPICLICRLSQEHQGHRVRPIEEAALEYKEQIQQQLERLRELRGSVEEHRRQGDKKTEKALKQTETQTQRASCQLEKLYQFLEQQEQLFVTWLQELSQTISKVRETCDTRVSQDIALLDELIGELEAKQDQPEWKLLQDIGVTLHRAERITVSEPLATPADVKQQIHLLYQKSKFVEKNMQRFSETLRCEMKALSTAEAAQWGGHCSGTAEAPGLILKCYGGDTQNHNIVFYSQVEAVGPEPQDHLQPEPAQGTPETLSQKKRKRKSLLNLKALFFQN
ncbi:pyrin [Psammomys obesus]|uniref:pyrin n=1 Tax=Psammomys obesus TaxID=48139 RepID=UPI00245334DC|nr:pyrin [Psammomys obesus]